MAPRLHAICGLAFAGLAAWAFGFADEALAQDTVAQFYKGKTVTVIIGSSPGGGYDAYGRLVARYIGKYIPGNPTVIASNMPGAASIVLSNHLYNVAPQDGTQIAAVYAGALLEPLLGDRSHAKYDPLKFNYLGNSNHEGFVCIARNDSPIKDFQDLYVKELVLGATADGSSTAEVPGIVNSILGTKYKIIKGYAGSREITLAVEKGEVQGACGIGYSTLALQYPDILKGTSFARIYIQDDTNGLPEINKAGVATSVSFAKTADDRSALELYFSQSQFTRPLILGPGVPADRLAALRKAFIDAMRDPELVAESKKINPHVEWTSGEDLQAMIKRIYSTPANVVDRVRKALGHDK